MLYNSHKLKPLIYKIAGSWSNHEGSMLLWIISISLPTFLFGVFSNNNLPTKNLTLILQAILAFMFVLYTIYTSNPFERILPAPVRGLGMNPLLQDIGGLFSSAYIIYWLCWIFITIFSKFISTDIKKYRLLD